MGSVSFATESGGIVNDPSAGAKKDSGPTIPTAEELARLKQAVEDSPQEAKTHYAYAHALRLLAKNERAVTEYLDATALEPTLYVAYHELALSKARPDQLDQAIERLELLKEHRPKDLLLCVALSELYEQRDNLYFAAKVLSDLLHTNSVPEKYLARVKTRVHYLLTKNKDAQAASQIQHDDLEGESAPLPLPESSLKRNLSAGQMKDARVMQSFGHAPLLP
jgi:tetratricopeptide (TPR) repeat protein